MANQIILVSLFISLLPTYSFDGFVHSKPTRSTRIFLSHEMGKVNASHSKVSQVSRKYLIKAASTSIIGLLLAKPAVCESREQLYFNGQYGLQDGLFNDCRNIAACTSSQDDRPSTFLEPWSYDGSYEKAKKKLLGGLLNLEPNAYIQFNDYRYIRADIPVNGQSPDVVDVLEFFFTPNDNTIQFRAERQGVISDFGKNRRRINLLRIKCEFEFVPVLRNRKRAFGFGESPLDSFGPSSNDYSQVEREIDPLSPVLQPPSKQERAILEGSKVSKPY